jgi:hypothetical protein
MKWERHAARMSEKNRHKYLKPQGKKYFYKSIGRRENNIKICYSERGCGNISSIPVVQDRKMARLYEHNS